MIFFLQVFFQKSSTPSPASLVSLASFKLFLKICENICILKCTAGILDTSSKFTTGDHLLVAKLLKHLKFRKKDI